MDSTEIIVTVTRVVFAVIGVILTRVVVPVIKQWYENNVRADMKAIIKEAVEAAEQTVKGTGKGTVKKEKVLKSVSEWLTSKGYTIDEKMLDDLIEAAVYGLNKGKEEKKE